MRILAVSHPCVTDVNQQFYAELEGLSHEVSIVVPRNFVTQYSKIPVEVSRWPGFTGDIVQLPVGFNGHIQLHYYKRRLAKQIRQYQPDVLFVEEEPYSLSALQAFRASAHLPLKRVIYSAQNIYKKFPYPFRWSENYVLSQAHAVAVTSDAVANVLKQKGFTGTQVPFPLGVDTNQFNPNADSRGEIRRQLGLGETDFVVGYVGRFVREKGIEVLIDMMPALSREGMKILCVGNGPMLDALQHCSKAYPNTMSIAPSVPHRDVPKWMNAIDCLIIPSLTTGNWKEQFGRVILEAMACQVPVLGSDSGEIPKLIKTTQGGWTFPEGNTEKALDILVSIRHSPSHRNEKATAGWEYVTNHYSKRAVAESFSRDVEGLLQPAAKQPHLLTSL